MYHRTPGELLYISWDMGTDLYLSKYWSFHELCINVSLKSFGCTGSYLQIYRKINIRVVLSALEIWTDTDHVAFVKQAGEDLRNFENHHSSSLAGVKYDSVHLLRQETKTRVLLLYCVHLKWVCEECEC